MKKVKILTENGIQEILKQIITPSELKSFFSKVITADSLNKYSFLLNTGNLLTESILLTKLQRVLRDKYIYDLIIAMLYIEAMSIEDITTLINSDYTEIEIKNIFEKIVVLEYDLYQIPASFSVVLSPTNFDRKVFIRDLTIPVYHSTNIKLAYKDLDNLITETNKIHTDVIANYTTNGFIEGIEKLSLFRINEKLSIAEGEDIAVYSFLFNYNITNKNFIRKSLALESDGSGGTKGYYKKLVGGILTTICFNDTVNTDQDITVLYTNYSRTPNADAEEAHNFILEYRDQLLKRTINYYEQ